MNRFVHTPQSLSDLSVINPYLGSLWNDTLRSIIVLICLFFSHSSWSACTRHPSIPFSNVQNIILDLGTIIVPEDLAINQVIKLQRFTINRRTNAWRCTGGRGQLIGQITCDTCPDFNQDTYFGLPDDDRIIKTSIPGIGVRLSRQALEGAQRYITYPDNGVTINNDGTPNLNEAEFVVEILKIAETVGSGLFTDAISFKYRGDGNLNGQAVLGAEIVANSILVAKSSCIVDYPLAVTLPTVSTQEFTGIGTTLGKTGFTLNLSCGALNIDNPNGDDLSGFLQNPAIAFSFDYDRDSSAASDRGAMLNTLTDGAAGVALELLQTSGISNGLSESPVLTSTKNTGCVHFTDPNCSPDEDENWIEMGTLEEVQQNSRSLDLAVQYLQTSNTVTAGGVQARTTFTVIYH